MYGISIRGQSALQQQRRLLFSRRPELEVPAGLSVLLMRANSKLSTGFADLAVRLFKTRRSKTLRQGLAFGVSSIQWSSRAHILW